VPAAGLVTKVYACFEQGFNIDSDCHDCAPCSALSSPTRLKAQGFTAWVVSLI
jgi:hypothetical protein